MFAVYFTYFSSTAALKLEETSSCYHRCRWKTNSWREMQYAIWATTANETNTLSLSLRIWFSVQEDSTETNKDDASDDDVVAMPELSLLTAAKIRLARISFAFIFRWKIICNSLSKLQRARAMFVCAVDDDVERQRLRNTAMNIKREQTSNNKRVHLHTPTRARKHTHDLHKSKKHSII